MLDAGLRAPRGLIVRAAGNTMCRRMGWAEYSTDRHDPASADDVDWYSSLSLGGLSNYWTAAVPRFAPDDFTDGARLDERYRWPVTYDDLVAVLRARRADADRHRRRRRSPASRRTRRASHRRLPPDWQRLAADGGRHGHGVGALPMAKGRPWMVARRGTEFGSYHCVVAAAARLAALRACARAPTPSA